MKRLILAMSPLALAATCTAGSAVEWWTVPAMSAVPRFADTYPSDGEQGGTLRVVAARGEFESASFVVRADGDIAKFQVTTGDLRSKDGGVIPAANLDPYVIKVWYQNGNAWWNYFTDVGLRLCPELLLHDETLIKVDEKERANYVRVDYPTGSKYRWVSPPREIDPGFKTAVEPVADAATLQPVKLEKGKFKQFWLNVKVPLGTKPGLYKGKVEMKGGGGQWSIPVALRVLPFALPDPKTYYDLNSDFYAMLYVCGTGSIGTFMKRNGGDRKNAEKKLWERLKSQAEHGYRDALYLGYRSGAAGEEQTAAGLALAKKAGMRTDPLFEAFSCSQRYTAADDSVPEAIYDVRYNAKKAGDFMLKTLGHKNLWPAGGEEPSIRRIVQFRDVWKEAHKAGFKVMCNGQDRRTVGGWNDDLRVHGGSANAEHARFCHNVKGKIGNYAGPHNGPENPEFMRRRHGMSLYKKDFDMTYNYDWCEGDWNDLRYSYRITAVYETREGFVSTMQWEGMREGIDDIRYSTLLLQLAEEAYKAGPAQTEKFYAGRKAMRHVALFDGEAGDLDAYRMETVNHILKLMKLLGKEVL